MIKAHVQKKKSATKTSEAKVQKPKKSLGLKSIISRLKASAAPAKKPAKASTEAKPARKHAVVAKATPTDKRSGRKGKDPVAEVNPAARGEEGGENSEESTETFGAAVVDAPLETAEISPLELTLAVEPPSLEEARVLPEPQAAVRTPEFTAPDEADLDVSSLYFRDISEYRILTAGEEKSAFEEMEKILREAWKQVLEVPQIHPEFANSVKEVLKANLGRIHEAARTYAAREGDPEVQKILRAKAPGMFTNRNRFSTTLMRIDPDLIILDGVIKSFSRFTRAHLKGQAALVTLNMTDEEKPSYDLLKRSLGSKEIERLRDSLKSVRRHRVLITNKRNAFLAANLKLVISVAKKYRGHSLTFDDMIQEGNMGLMTAIGRFDHRLGYKFSTYATWWIRQSITRALSVKDRTIRLPVHLHEIYYRVRRVTSELKEKLSRSPTPEEIAEAAGLRPDQIKDYSHLFVEPESLDAGHDSDDDRTLGEFIPDGELVPSDEATEHFRLSEEIKELLKSLTPREEDILRRRFGIGQGRDYTLQEIAERYHLTRERIRQIEAKGLEKLRRPNRKRNLEEYNREMLS